MDDELAAQAAQIRKERKERRRKPKRAYRRSRSDLYAAEIKKLREDGMSFRAIEEWLLRFKGVGVDHSTIGRFLTKKK